LLFDGAGAPAFSGAGALTFDLSAGAVVGIAAGALVSDGAMPGLVVAASWCGVINDIISAKPIHTHQ